MINPKHLRIGNYIKINSAETWIGRVTTIYKHNEEFYVSIPQVGMMKDWQLEPIELTDSILAKCYGLERVPDTSTASGHFKFEVDSNIFFLRPSYEGGYYWGIIDDELPPDPKDWDATELFSVKPIKTVHDFQNWYFANTGGVEVNLTL
jgi:hypothetical protein